MPFVRKNKILSILLLIFSVYLYQNYTRIVEVNTKVDKNDKQYVNDLYMSDGRIYNNYLTKKEKKMYNHILNNSKKYTKSTIIDFNEFGCSDYVECGDLIDIAHDAIIIDHPELVNYASYMWVYKDGVFNLKLVFAVSQPISERIGVLRTQRIIQDIKNATKDMNDKEKIKYVYNWIGEHNEYDKMFTYASKNQSIYNVFMKENAVCAGFAKASQVIFQNIGIESYGITGESTGPHMWNVIKYKDKYYYYDSTVAVSIKEQNHSMYYKGLDQEYMNSYTIRHPEWYPKIEENTIFISKKNN